MARTTAAAVLLGLLLVGCSMDESNQPTAPGTSPTLARTPSGEAGTLTNKSVHHDDRTRLEAALVGTSSTPAASGKARWEQRSDRTRFKLEVENTTTSGQHVVKVNGAAVTTVSVNGGKGEIELDSRHGDIIPTMQAGDRVAVFSPEGDVIAEGVLQ
jgi:outer membrane biogenesis lipoprotein LolB